MSAFKLEEIQDGIVSKVINRAMGEIVENILDTTTSASNPRKLIVTVTVTPNEERNTASVGIDVQPKLVNPKTIQADFRIDKEKAQLNELVRPQDVKIKGQTYINEDGEVCDETGSPIEGE